MECILGRGACLISWPWGWVIIRGKGRGAYLRKYGDHNSKSMRTKQKYVLHRQTTRHPRIGEFELWSCGGAEYT